jgi:hypothetical protein
MAYEGKNMQAHHTGPGVPAQDSKALAQCDRRKSVLPVLAGVALACALPVPAGAHVRWFTTVADAATPPVPITALLASPSFLLLFVLMLVVAAWVHGVDSRLQAASNAFTRMLDRTDAFMTPVAAPLLQYGLALYFASIALYFSAAPIALTPELKVGAAWVMPLQVLIALAFLFRPGVIAACVGIVLLYVYSIHLYGLVHLLDYHLFLGVCVFLVLTRVSRHLGSTTGMLVLRLLVATSLMWVGVEKWMYPHWTHDVLVHQLPVLLMGMDPEFYGMAAGCVEVALAFLLLFGGVSSQVAAAVLLALMSAAIPLVGVVDGIGHMPILVALFILATTRNRVAQRMQEHTHWKPLDLCGLFLITVPGVGGLYFLTHQLASRRDPFEPAPDLALSLLWTIVLLLWVCWAGMAWLRQRQARRVTPTGGGAVM